MALDITWEQFQQFLLIDKHHSKKPQAVYANCSRFRIFKRYFTDKEWSIINFRQLIYYYEQKRAAQGTINKLISFGKYIDEYLGTEITKTFKTRVEKINHIEDIIKPDEIVKLAKCKIHYAKNGKYISQRQKALIMLLGTSGCRISEALGLKWVNLYRTPIKHVEFLDTKNGEDRKVWLDEDVYNLLDNLPRKGDYVFDSYRSGHLLGQQINADLKRRAKACKINKRIYNHLFRHSFATTMLEQGVSDSDVCKITGWKDPKVLLRYKNSKLEYYSKVMQMHPLLQSKLSWKERNDRLIQDITKYFDPLKFQIVNSLREGEINITIKSIHS